MAGTIEVNFGPFTGVAGEDLAAYRRVKISAATWVYADMNDEAQAITGPSAVASGGTVTLYPITASGIIPLTGCKAIPRGSLVYPAADGKVTDVAGPKRALGILMDDISADGGQVGAMLNVYSFDMMARNTNVYEYREDFISGLVYDGGKFSETADRSEWLKTSVDGDADGADVCAVQDDGPGGILRILCNNKAADREEIQLNGESFKLATGKPLWFESKFAIEDVDASNEFVGLALTDTTVMTTTGMTVTDYVGFKNLHDGTILFCVCQDSTEKTGTGAALTDCAAVANFATTAKRFGFYWDGAGVLTAFVDGTLTATLTDDGALTMVPDDEALTPTIAVGTSATATEAIYVDYIHIVGTR